MGLNLNKIQNKKVEKFLISHCKYKTNYLCPNLKSIVLNTNLGLELEKNDKFREEALYLFELISAQKPKLILAKRSVSNFKLRKEDKSSLICHIRKKNLTIFLTKLVFFVIPQLETWDKTKVNLDKNLNFNFGLSEHLFFPEIGFSFNKKSFGLNININFINKKNENHKLYLLKFFNIL